MTSRNFDTVSSYLASTANPKEQVFKEHLFAAYKLQDHPKVEALYRIAFSLGSTDGLFQVLFYFDLLSELLR